MNAIIKNSAAKYLPVVLIGVFALMYATFAMQHKIGNYGVETDFYGLYAADAQRILNLEMAQERDHPPGYALLVAVFSVIFGDFFLAGKILSVLTAIGCLIVFYGLVKLIYDKNISMVTLALVGLFLLPFAFIVGIDIVFTFFFLLAIYLFFKSDGSNKRLLIWSGIVSGITFSIRYNGIILLMGVFVILFFLNWQKQSIQEKIKRFAFYFVPFILVMLPWFIFSLTQEGEVSSPGLNAAIAWEFYGPGGEFSGDDRQLVDPKFYSLTTLVTNNVRHFVSHYAKNIVDRFKQFVLEGFYFPAFYFILPGMIIAIALSSMRQLALFVFFILGFLVLCLVNFVIRYYLFILPFAVILIALFFFAPFPDNLSLKGLSFKNIRWLFLAVIVIFVMRNSLFLAKYEIQSEPRDLLKMARIIENDAQGHQGIIARKPHLAYFAGFKNEHFPDAKSVDDLINYAQQKDSRYILYGPQEKRYRPQLNILTAPDSVKSKLQLLYQDKENNYLYKVR